MCLAIPMKIIDIEGLNATVEIGGTKRDIRLDIVDKMPNISDYVIVHAGFAIHRIDENEAEAILEDLRMIFNLEIKNESNYSATD